MAAQPARAAATPAYEIYVSDAPLELVLTVLSRDLGIEFVSEANPRRRVRDLQLKGSAEEVMASLLRAIGMVGFAFNGQVFLSSEEDRQVRLVRLEGLGTDKAFAALAEAGLLVPQFDVAAVAEGKALVLSGPVKYLAICESVIASLEREAPPAQPVVRVRRGGQLVTAGGSGIPPRPDQTDQQERN